MELCKSKRRLIYFAPARLVEYQEWHLVYVCVRCAWCISRRINQSDRPVLTGNYASYLGAGLPTPQQAQHTFLCLLVTNLCWLKSHKKTAYLITLFYLCDNSWQCCASNARILLQSHLRYLISFSIFSTRDIVCLWSGDKTGANITVCHWSEYQVAANIAVCLWTGYQTALNIAAYR